MPAPDLIVVGAGILGMAHALAAARRGLRVRVLERDARANGASIRNFGFVTITGQEPGETRRRALRSRDVWEEVAPQAGIEVLQRGALFVARRPEAMAVLEEFAAGEMGTECSVLNAAQARGRYPALREGLVGALFSPLELRIEAREAVGKLACWLGDRHGVEFSWGDASFAIDPAQAAVIAPGMAVAEFAPRYAREVALRLCTLQMMRIADPGWRAPAVVMSDLSLLRYGGMASQASAAALRRRVEAECPRHIAAGVHLIAAQSADGSMVIGDSHRYAGHAEAFASTELDELILGEIRAVFDMGEARVTERWLGHYPVADVKPLLREAIAGRVRLVSVTNGLGMSTAFAIAEETIAELFG